MKIGKRPFEAILTPEQFERFASTAFRAESPELREAALLKITGAYRALYDSPLGKLWHLSQRVVEHAVDPWGESRYFEVPRKTFLHFSNAVNELTHREGRL